MAGGGGVSGESVAATSPRRAAALAAEEFRLTLAGDGLEFRFERIGGLSVPCPPAVVEPGLLRSSAIRCFVLSCLVGPRPSSFFIPVSVRVDRPKPSSKPNVRDRPCAHFIVRRSRQRDATPSGSQRLVAVGTFAMAIAADLEMRMPDDTTKTCTYDRSRISPDEPYEVRDWAMKFGVSKEELMTAIEQVGSNSSDVEALLKKQK